MLFYIVVTRSCRTKKSAGCYFFNVAGKVSPEQIHSAELWIYKLFNRNDPYSQTYLLSELGKSANKKRTPKKDVNRIETTLKYGWLKINVKKTVLHWLMKPHRNFGLTILCKFCQRKNHKTIFSSKRDSMPFLVINTRVHSQRHKRSMPRRCTEHTRECCLASLEINFSEIGWNWVTAPSSFRANYCTGSCHEQYAAHYNHTQVIQDYRWSPAGHARMSEVIPCCSPISFKSQSILYIDAHGSIRLAKIPNISATACGCM
ncbi:hypothetical protein KUTeg_016062 [Tegillarca granosa]|uniref:TGF-beta family profile domain-containing protein n=1 Tax=Tegillarca granosa TaxID=220873 RepID=A0ABQ9EPI1_TEGGR|nr:hypothetical protein KUTeg_016062 [Tegillarca granosa]